MIGPLPAEVAAGNFAQVRVHQGSQRLDRFVIALRPAIQQHRDVSGGQIQASRAKSSIEATFRGVLRVLEYNAPAQRLSVIDPRQRRLSGWSVRTRSFSFGKRPEQPALHPATRNSPARGRPRGLLSQSETRLNPR